MTGMVSGGDTAEPSALSRSRITMDTSPGVMRKIPSAQRSSPIVSAEQMRVSSGRHSSNIKNYESTLKGIEGLRFDKEEKVEW